MTQFIVYWCNTNYINWDGRTLYCALVHLSEGEDASRACHYFAPPPPSVPRGCALATGPLRWNVRHRTLSCVIQDTMPCMMHVGYGPREQAPGQRYSPVKPGRNEVNNAVKGVRHQCWFKVTDHPNVQLISAGLVACGWPAHQSTVANLSWYRFLLSHCKCLNAATQQCDEMKQISLCSYKFTEARHSIDATSYMHMLTCSLTSNVSGCNCAKRCKTVQNSSAVPSASGMPCSEFKFTVRWWGLVHWVWPTDKFWFSLTPFPPPSCWSPNLHQNLAKKYPRGPTGTPFEHLHNAPHTLPQISYEITPPLLLTLSSSGHDNQYQDGVFHIGPQVPIGDLTPNNKFFSQIQMASWNDKVWITCSDSDGFLDW